MGQIHEQDIDALERQLLTRAKFLQCPARIEMFKKSALILIERLPEMLNGSE